MTTTTSPDERPWLVREVAALREQTTQLSAASVWSMSDRDVAEVDEPLAQAMAAGALLPDLATVIAKVTSDLGTAEVPPEVVSQARDYLLEESRNHDSRVLRRLGQRVLE